MFGLSMDYEVFMLSRIREEYRRTADPVTSVADGLASTARVITAAAAIMVAVFISFGLEDDREIKQLRVGLAVAILIDATVVRLLMVPVTMQLMGARNWWMPRWLDRLLPRLDVEPVATGPLPVRVEAPVQVWPAPATAQPSEPESTVAFNSPGRH